MHTLPMTSVETAPVARAAARNENIGIVPPWLVPTLPVASTPAPGNTGIVPPWMLTSVKAAHVGAANVGIIPPYMRQRLEASQVADGNTGIVPPWMKPTAA